MIKTHDPESSCPTCSCTVRAGQALTRSLFALTRYSDTPALLNCQTRDNGRKVFRMNSTRPTRWRPPDGKQRQQSEVINWDSQVHQKKSVSWYYRHQNSAEVSFLPLKGMAVGPYGDQGCESCPQRTYRQVEEAAAAPGTRQSTTFAKQRSPQGHKINHSLIIHQVKVLVQYNVFKKTGKWAIHFRQTSIPSD